MAPDDRTDWRLDQLEAWQQRCQEAGLPTEQAKQGQRLDDVEERVDKLDDRIQANTRALVGLAMSVAGSAVIFAVSVLLATGRVG